jgi:hypothetical protein
MPRDVLTKFCMKLYKALHEVLYEALCIEALHQVPAIFLIAFTCASAKYTPYIATLFFTYPSFLISSLPLYLTSSLPRTAASRGLSPELDDHCLNNRPANATNDSIN